MVVSSAGMSHVCSSLSLLGPRRCHFLPCPALFVDWQLLRSPQPPAEDASVALVTHFQMGSGRCFHLCWVASTTAEPARAVRLPKWWVLGQQESVLGAEKPCCGQGLPPQTGSCPMGLVMSSFTDRIALFPPHLPPFDSCHLSSPEP